MTELERELFEQRLISIAKGLDYPRTPDIAASVMMRIRPSTRPRFISRKLAWSLAIILVLCSSLMLIPPVRAAILEFIQIGIVRIFPNEPTPLPFPNEEIPSTIIPITATPGPTLPSLLPLLENIAGEMTLSEAQQRVNFPILLPAYPSDLGQPDYVFIQDAGGALVVLVWLEPQQPERVRLSLHFIQVGSWAIDKERPTVIQETNVHGQRAIWAVGAYPLKLSDGDLQFMRLIDGNVLIWAEDDITYRLETDLPLEEALKTAESLQPVP